MMSETVPDHLPSESVVTEDASIEATDAGPSKVAEDSLVEESKNASNEDSTDIIVTEGGDSEKAAACAQSKQLIIR